jgi:hypothetical protein
MTGREREPDAGSLGSLGGLSSLIKRILAESSFVLYDPGRPLESGGAFVLSPFSEGLARGVLVTVVAPAMGANDRLLLLDRMHDVLVHEGFTVAEFTAASPAPGLLPPGATFTCLSVYYPEMPC